MQSQESRESSVVRLRVSWYPHHLTPFNHGSISIQEKKDPKQLCHGYKDHCIALKDAVFCRYIGEDIESNQDEDLHGVQDSNANTGVFRA